MSRLGEFLERFFGPAATFDSLHASVRHVRKSASQASSSGQRLVIGRHRRDAKLSELAEEHFVFWARLPDRLRVEATRLKDGQAETSIEIVNGEDRWVRHRNGAVEHSSEHRHRSTGGNSFPTEFQRHFDRDFLRQCFAALTLEANGTCQVAGRECLSIRAVQIPGARLWPHWLAWEASEFEFAVDVQRAVLLSIAGKVDGETIEVHEVQNVTFDEEIDDSLLLYEPHLDEAVGPAIPIVERITLQAAVARAPFTVLQPTWLPESQRVQGEAMYHPARHNSPDEHLSIHYRGGKSFDHLWINQRAAREKRMQRELEWEEMEREGRRLEISDPSPAEGLKVAVFEHIQTHVEIISDLSRDDLANIADSMAPVSV